VGQSSGWGATFRMSGTIRVATRKASMIARNASAKASVEALSKGKVPELLSRRHHRSPAQARKPAGQDPMGENFVLYEGRNSDALFPGKVQLFLSGFSYCWFVTRGDPDVIRQ
jgi:hypothetical protein